jgi:hypothetical protein
MLFTNSITSSCSTSVASAAQRRRHNKEAGEGVAVEGIER